MVADMEIWATMACSGEAWFPANKHLSSQPLAQFDPSSLAAKWLCHLDSRDGGTWETWYHHPKWSGPYPVLRAVCLRPARVKEAVLLWGKSDFIKSSTSQKLEQSAVHWEVEENTYVWYAHKHVTDFYKCTHQPRWPLLTQYFHACSFQL